MRTGAIGALTVVLLLLFQLSVVSQSPPPAIIPPRDVDGKIFDVRPTLLEIDVQEKNGPVYTVLVDDRTIIGVDGRFATIYDLEIGMKAGIWYRPLGQPPLAALIDATNPSP